MLEIRHLNFSYHRDDVYRDASFQAKRGYLTVIKGESGKGKTTLLNILALKFGDDFELYYNGKSVKECREEYLDDLYYVGHEPLFCLDLTIGQSWDLIEKRYGKAPDISDYIEILGLQDVYHLYPNQLSGGEKLRVSLINALMICPKVVFFDEPTASLDDDYKDKFIGLLNCLKEFCILVVASHDPHLFKEADVLYEIEDNKLVLIKENKNELTVKEKPKETNKVFLMPYFIKMKKHHPGKEILTLFILSLAVSLCAFSFNLDSDFIANYDNYLSLLESNTILVYKELNRAVPGFDGMDASFYFPFSSEEYDEIRSIDHIKSISPEIVLSGEDKDHYPQLKIYDANNYLIYDYNDLADFRENSLESHCVKDLYYENIDDRQIKEYISKEYNHEFNGLYINAVLLEEMGLSDTDLKNCTVEIELAVPIYDVAGAMEIDIQGPGMSYYESFDDDMMPANDYKCESVVLRLPLNGIIDTGYNSDMLALPQNALYLRSDYLQSLIDEYRVDEGYVRYFYEDEDFNLIEVKNSEEAQYMHIYTPYRYNAYKIESDDLIYLDEIVDQLKLSGFSVEWAYNRFKNVSQSIFYTKRMCEMVSSLFLVFVCLIVGIFNFIKGHQEHDLNQWFKDIGYKDRKDLIRAKMNKHMVNSVIVFISAFMIAIVFDFILLYTIHNKYITTPITYIIVVMFIFIITLLTQMVIPLFWEVYDYARN